MTYRAYIEPDYPRRGVAIHIVEHRQPGDTPVAYVLQPTDLVMGPHNEAEYTPAGLRMPDELGRALLDALSAHYGGTSDTRQLRADYEHERGRVDKFITHLISREA